MHPPDIPLVGQPGVILVVHPDSGIRQAISDALPAEWVVTFAQDEATAQRALRLEHSFRVAHELARAEVITHASRGSDLVPAVLRYWAKYTERFELTRACIVGSKTGHEPDISWLQERTEGWEGARVLVDGSTRYDVHVDATVSLDDLARLPARLMDALSVADHRLALSWVGELPPALRKTLSPPEVNFALQEKLRRWGQDYVILADPFGALTLQRDGGVRWLAFAERHTHARLPEGVTYVQERAWQPLGDSDFGVWTWELQCESASIKSASTYDTWLSSQQRRHEWS